MAKAATIERAIRRLLRARGPGKSICPSEVARDIAPEGWRALMAPVRAAAAKLAEEGEVVVTQKGAPVDPLTAKGPIRIADSRRGGGDHDR